MLRPASARWFELLTAREQLEQALRVLADTGAVELEAASEGDAPRLLPQLSAALEEYHHLAQSYAPYWPEPARKAGRLGSLEAAPQEAAARLRDWVQAAGPLVAQLQRSACEEAEVAELHSVLEGPSGERVPGLARLPPDGAIVGTLHRLDPSGAVPVPDEDSPLLIVPMVRGEQRYVLALGAAQEMQTLEEDLASRKARRLRLPGWLPASRSEALQALRARGEQLAGAARQTQEELAHLNAQHAVAEARADLDFAQWLLQHVPEMGGTEHFGWITGWTSERSGEALSRALQRAGVAHVLRFPEAPADLTRPMVLRNPRWARPFELFERLLGVPGSFEADPSVILAVMAPLMFGFMFGDVGQGAVLVGAGLALRRRFPALALLIPGGFAAMVFGLLFGSVFSREDWLPALWMHPLREPLKPLIVSLIFGAGVLLLGLLLDALQHHWAGLSGRWWRTRAGLLLAYVGMLGSALDRRALGLVVPGVLWFCVGSTGRGSGALSRLGAAFSESIETLLQLFVNTLSFVRVGAFALAHAGLAAAVQGLAAGTGSRGAAFLVLALGNLAIIVIEGLIVGIQTTRLVLFEFFIRFLRGVGRPFRPLPPPVPPPLHS